MKLVNYRSGWHVNGEFITCIYAGVKPTDDELLAYWHLKPGDARFADHAAPSKHARRVLLKHNGNFVIVPITDDIKEVVS